MKSISIEKHVRAAVQPSPRVLQVAAMFGLGVDDQREIAVVPRCEIPLPHLTGRSGIVFVTGPSGSGKSTILKLVTEALRGTDESDGGRCAVLQFDHLPPLPDVPLVDSLEALPLDRVLMLLSVAGLNEAFVMLRRPCELSDGQRYRLRLAQVMALLAQHAAARTASHAAPTAQDLRQKPAPAPHWMDGAAPGSLRSGLAEHCASNFESPPASLASAVVIADEFGSTLDRITAKTISRNLRRWLAKHAPMPVSFICATTHDDLLEALEPDVLVWKGLGEEVEVVVR